MSENVVDQGATQASADDHKMIADTLRRAAAGVEAGDVNALMAMFYDSPATFLFDYGPPRSVSYEELHTGFVAALGGIDGSFRCEYPEIHSYLLSADAAWSWSIMRVGFKMRGGSQTDLIARVTDIWRKIDGHWVAVHEHSSVPVDVTTGTADLQSKP